MPEEHKKQTNKKTQTATLKFWTVSVTCHLSSLTLEGAMKIHMLALAWGEFITNNIQA